MNMTLKISSEPTNIREVEHFVQDLCNSLNIHGDLHCNILISLTEAVNNAIHHGNCLDAKKFVVVSSGIEGQTLSVMVSDEGQGFDPADVPDPTLQDNICECGGRGVFLIRQLADDVQYLNNGSTVHLAFKLAQLGPH